MRKVQWILGFFLFASQIWGQGFIRPLEIPSEYSYARLEGGGLAYGTDSNQIQVWYSSFASQAYRVGVGLYDTERCNLQEFRFTSSGPNRAFFRRLKKNVILIQDGPGGGNHQGYPTWEIWDFNGGMEGWVFPNRYQASYLSFKDDSIFVLLAKPLIWESDTDFTYYHQAHDTNTLYYLTHIDPANSQYTILDSIRLVTNVRLAGLQYLEKSRQWELILQEERIRFSRSRFGIDTSFLDSNFALERFRIFDHDLDRARGNFFDRGLFKYFYNIDQKKIFDVQVNLKDSTYFDYSPLFTYFEQQGLEGWGYRNFSGNVDDLIAKKESSAIRDQMMRISDSLHLFRLKSGKILTHSSLKVSNYPEWVFLDALSDAKGGFYLSARSPRWDGDPYLIYLDPHGRMKIPQGDESFNLHFNTNDGSLKVFYEDPEAWLSYRIIDASGRNMQEGEFQAYEGISLGDWQTGVYYLQLWSKNQNYLGQESFLIHQ